MNATQKTLIAIGSVVLLAAGTFGYLAWDSYSQMTSVEEDLDAAVSSAERLMRSPIRLDNASVKALEADTAAFVAWRTNAFAAAARGDLRFEPMSNGAFKELMRVQAAKFSAMPGGAEGHLVKPGFGFGFKQYVTDGQLPPLKDVPRLQREWNDVALVVSLLAESGVSEIAEIAVRPPAEASAEAEKAKAKAKTKAKKSAKPGASDAAERPPAVTRLSVDFLTAPAGFGAALGALANATRFVTVEDFRFTREEDALAEAVGTEKKSDATAARGAQRRGRRGAVLAKDEAKKKGEVEKKTGLAFDPTSAPRLKVHLELSVRDFNTRADAEATAEEEAK